MTLGLQVPNRSMLETMYHWRANETQMDHYTCRPIADPGTEEQWVEKKLSAQRENAIQLLALVADGDVCLGRFQVFDYNLRNKSAEVGYYFPLEHRGKGYGKGGLSLLCRHVFSNGWKPLRKLLATTGSFNAPSIRILKACGFQQDGVMREHYNIDGHYHDQLLFSLIHKGPAER